MSLEGGSDDYDPDDSDHDPDLLRDPSPPHQTTCKIKGKSRATKGASKSKGRAPATKAKRKAAATKAPVKLDIRKLDRPKWPANDEMTPEMSLRKIRQLESGNDDEKLMACFARHVIKPGVHKRASCWVSNRSLRHAFSEHFNHDGFHVRSTWNQKQAGDFGLPDLFLRGVDKQRAMLDPHESVKDLIADTGHAPDVEGLTKDEHERLEHYGLHGEQDLSIVAEQPVTHDAQGVQNETELHVGDDEENVAHQSEHPVPMPSVKSQSRSNTEPRAIPEVTPSRDLTLPIKLERTESVVSARRTPSDQPKLSTPSTTGAESDHPYTAMPHITQGQQEQESTTSEPVQSAGPRSENNMRNVIIILIPKLCDILKDFPAAPDDKLFLPLLRQLVKAAVTNLSEVVEEKFLDLSTHVVTHCTSSLSTDQVSTSSLVRAVLRILSRHRHKMSADAYSLRQRGLNDAARANDIARLRAMHAQLMLLEAQHENEQNER